MDTAKVLYSKKLWVSDGRISATANVHCNQATSSGLHQNEEEAWALKSIKKNKPFSDKQKKFLEEKFMVSETTGRKLDPVTVAREMKTARQDGNGERLFSSSEVLIATQIQSFFSIEGQDVGDFPKMTQKIRKLSKWKKNLKTFGKM